MDRRGVDRTGQDFGRGRAKSSDDAVLFTCDHNVVTRGDITKPFLWERADGRNAGQAERFIEAGVLAVTVD